MGNKRHRTSSTLYASPAKRARTSGRSGRVTGSIYRNMGRAARFAWVNRRLIGRGIKVAHKWYKGGYRTKNTTQRKKKKDDAIEISQHNDLSLKHIGFYKVPGGVHRKTLASYTYRDIVPWIVSSVEGKQAVDFPECIFTRPMIIGDTSTNFAERYRLPDDFYNLNPYVTSMQASTFYPGPIPAIVSSDYLYIKNVKCTTRFLSMETIPQKVTCYWLMPNYDTGVNPITQWTSIINSKNLTQGAAGARQVVGTTTAVGGAESINTLSSSPWIHPEFRKNWKCIKKQQFVLQPGDQRNLSFNIIYNKAINRNTFLNLRTAGEFMKGFTVFPMIIAEGGLVGVGAAAATTASEVTTGSTKVGVLTDYMYHFGALPASRISTNRHVDHQIVDIDETTQYVKMIDDIDEVDTVDKL